MVSQWTQTTKFPFFKKGVCVTCIAVIQISSSFIFNSIYSLFFKKYKEPLLTFKIKVVYFHDLKLQSVQIGTKWKANASLFCSLRFHLPGDSSRYVPKKISDLRIKECVKRNLGSGNNNNIQHNAPCKNHSWMLKWGGRTPKTLKAGDLLECQNRQESFDEGILSYYKVYKERLPPVFQDG